MTMKRTASLLAGSAALLSLAGPALALPSLQLDIEGGSYEGGSEESVVIRRDQFNLLGYCDTRRSSCAGDYFLSLAVIGSNGSSVAAGTDFGSFTLNSTSYSLADFIFGTPPIENWTGTPDQDLAPHGVFPTLFAERTFRFLDGIGTEGTRTSVNVEDNPGTPLTGPGPLRYEGFAIDMSGLKDGFNLHFDLYNTELVARRRQGQIIGYDEKIKDFAPFSHDARAYGCERNCTTVPEPTTGALMGLGLVAGFFAARRRLMPAT